MYKPGVDNQPHVGRQLDPGLAHRRRRAERRSAHRERQPPAGRQDDRQPAGRRAAAGEDHNAGGQPADPAKQRRLQPEFHHQDHLQGGRQPPGAPGLQSRHRGQPVRTESGQHADRVHEPAERPQEEETVTGLAVGQERTRYHSYSCTKKFFSRTGWSISEHCSTSQLSPPGPLSTPMDEEYASSEACLSESQYQCIRFNAFQQPQWHALCDQNLTELSVVF
jgi:hypothetical protein